MKCYGLRGKIFNVLESYLDNRTQYVKVDDKLSYPTTVKYGIPQGTVLGPVMFLIYINSLLSLNISGSIISFADDTAILFEASSWQELKTIAETDMQLVKKWFQYNTLTLNCDKTYYLPFTSYANHLPNMGLLNVDHDTMIPEVDSVKYLGIVIDRHLKWDLQIRHVVQKIRGLLSRFKYLKKFMGIKQLELLYYALIQSQMSYGIRAWGGVNDCHLNNLNVLQKWLLKIIYNKDIYYPSDLLYTNSKILDSRQLFCQSMLLAIFNNKINITCIRHIYNTRQQQQNNCQLPRCQKTIGQRSFTYLAPRLYDILPSDIKNIVKNTDSTKKFKAKLKQWILQTPRHFIHNLINQNVNI